MNNAAQRFTVILSGLKEMADAVAIALYDAGCDDESPESSDEVAFVGFDREATSLPHTICSAAADLRQAGFDIVRIEIETDDLAFMA